MVGRRGVRSGVHLTCCFPPDGQAYARVKSKTEPWIAALRQTLKDEGYRDGWSVLNRRCRVQIQRTWLGPDGVRHRKGISTSIVWERGCTSAVLSALAQLQQGLDRGLQIDEAAKLLVVSPSTSHQRTGVNWEVALAKWRQEKLSQGMLPRTFDKTDGMRLKHILKRVTESAPENGVAFARLAPFNPQGVEYAARSTSRRCYVNSCCQFLEFCVEDLGIDEKWLPPSNRTKLRGGKGAPSAKDAQAPNAGKAIPFPDYAVKPLMDSFPDTTIGRRWRLAVGFLIVYGIRGVELNHLRWDHETGELWSNYIKRNKTGETKPRLLIPIDPPEMPGLAQSLILEWTMGLTKLPPMGTDDSGASLAILIYLNRRPIWKQLRENTQADGRRLSIYSFRHAYAKRLDGQNFPSRSSAVLMGHSRQTFERSYGDKELSPEEIKRQAATLL